MLKRSGASFLLRSSGLCSYELRPTQFRVTAYAVSSFRIMDDELRSYELQNYDVYMRYTNPTMQL